MRARAMLSTAHVVEARPPIRAEDDDKTGRLKSRHASSLTIATDPYLRTKSVEQGLQPPADVGVVGDGRCDLHDRVAVGHDAPHHVIPDDMGGRMPTLHGAGPAITRKGVSDRHSVSFSEW